MEITTRVDRSWLLRKTKHELVQIILGNLDRIDLFADKPVDLMDSFAFNLSVAWGKYVGIFGEPPHGTKQQFAAMLEMLPRILPQDRRDSTPPGL
jgi:hypothetical protein